MAPLAWAQGTIKISNTSPDLSDCEELFPAVVLKKSVFFRFELHKWSPLSCLSTRGARLQKE